MKGIRIGLSLLALAFVAGCSGDDCPKIEKKVCEGKDDAFCQKAKQRLWSQTGPDNKPLAKDEIKAFCKMMTADKDLDAWVKGFQSSVARSR
ncbi:MAG: hypothetical protein HYY84_13325 [Deltaproteobacteria bacterium]|nr:hypothetical protein [Deltaproteobacteria bacterium]